MTSLQLHAYIGTGFQPRKVVNRLSGR